MAYRGSLPTSMFNDRQVRAKDFAKWRHATSKLARGRDRDTVDRYKAEIERGGLKKPIWLDVSDRTGWVYIGDGHHRAVALLELGVVDFDFHWRLTSKGGWFSQPPLESDPFPYRLLGVA
ncbi:MAG TPA: ParB N-terminal domain-containing protein [Streptomyces sp.]